MSFGGLGSAVTGRSAALGAAAPDADAAAFDSVPGAGFDSRPMAAAIVPPAGRISGTGPSLAVNPAENNAFRAINRAIKAGHDVQFVPVTAAGSARYVINGMSEADQDALVKALALTAERVAAAPGTMKASALALINAPTGMDEGWTRWVLDQYGFDYTRLAPADVDAGGLRTKFDVIIVSDDATGVLGGGGRGGGRGGGGGGGGAQVGTGASSVSVTPGGTAPVLTGQRVQGNPPAPGSGADARIAAIDEFVKAGGTLVCFNRASTFAIDQLHLPVKNAIAGVNRTQFFVGGSLLNVITTPAHRVMAGMPEQAAVFYDGGPVFETQDGFKGVVLAKYADTGSPLASGFLLGEKYLQGQGRRARCRTRHRPRRAARFPAAVARAAVRHVPGDLQRGALCAVKTGTCSECRECREGPQKTTERPTLPTRPTCGALGGTSNGPTLSSRTRADRRGDGGLARDPGSCIRTGRGARNRGPDVHRPADRRRSRHRRSPFRSGRAHSWISMRRRLESCASRLALARKPRRGRKSFAPS